MKIGRLLLRALVGGFFIGHGTQKLFGWFGGQGLQGTAGAFDSMGMKPGQVHATAAGIAETAGGAGILLGYETPFAASSLIAVMLTAINRVHLKKGPWAFNGGYEYNAVLIASAATLAEIGPGKLSIDGIRKRQRSGPLWALASLALGTLGAAGAHFLAESQSARGAYAAPVPTETWQPSDAQMAAEPPAPTDTLAPIDDATTVADVEPEPEPAGVETAE